MCYQQSVKFKRPKEVFRETNSWHQCDNTRRAFALFIIDAASGAIFRGSQGLSSRPLEQPAACVGLCSILWPAAARYRAILCWSVHIRLTWTEPRIKRRRPLDLAIIRRLVGTGRWLAGFNMANGRNSNSFHSQGRSTVPWQSTQHTMRWAILTWAHRNNDCHQPTTSIFRTQGRLWRQQMQPCSLPCDALQMSSLGNCYHYHYL